MNIGHIMSRINTLADKSGDRSGFFEMVFIEAICLSIISAIIAAIVCFISDENKFVDVFKNVFICIFMIDLIIWSISLL